MQDPFLFSERITGSTISYTINYSDSLTGISCGVIHVPASSCRAGTCYHTFEVPSSCLHSDGINVTVYATNALGNGPPSQPITTGIQTEATLLIHYMKNLLMNKLTAPLYIHGCRKI